MTPEQKRAYQDVMITFLESGYSTWAEAKDIKRIYDQDHKMAGYEHFFVRAEDADKGTPWTLVTVKTIEKGIEALLSGKVKVAQRVLVPVAMLRARPEDADYDAETADCIVQAAVLGDLVYG